MINEQRLICIVPLITFIESIHNELFQIKKTYSESNKLDIGKHYFIIILGIQIRSFINNDHISSCTVNKTGATNL